MKKIGRLAVAIELLALAMSACDGREIMAPESWSAASLSAAHDHDPGLTGPPLCGGLPATIWVGMDPTLLPVGASIILTAVDHDHLPDDAGLAVSGLNDDAEGDCGCDDGEDSPFRYLIVGTVGDDVIVGSSNPDSIVGLAGNDLICGRQARDALVGGIGDDRLYGGPGADRIHGGHGIDFLEGGPGSDRLWGANGDDWLYGMSGRDQLFGENGDDHLFGGKSPDLLDGGRGLNHLDYGPEICEGGDAGHDGGCSGGHDDGGCPDGDHEDHEDGGCTDDCDTHTAP